MCTKESSITVRLTLPLATRHCFWRGKNDHPTTQPGSLAIWVSVHDLCSISPGAPVPAFKTVNPRQPVTRTLRTVQGSLSVLFAFKGALLTRPPAVALPVACQMPLFPGMKWLTCQ